MNSVEDAGWINDKVVITKFLVKMGLTTDFREQVYEVGVNWIPATFEAKSPTK